VSAADTSTLNVKADVDCIAVIRGDESGSPKDGAAARKGSVTREAMGMLVMDKLPLETRVSA